MRATVLAMTISLLIGCASMNDALTPSMQVKKDSFDNSTVVIQEPVSSAGSIKEAWHTLGFSWNQKTPDIIYITVGTNGIVNITNVAFNADGKIISNIKTASATTEYGQWSTRRFAMSWDDFQTVANAQLVKMKVSRINDYTVSSFGKERSGATINSKFPPFIAKVSELRASIKQ